MNTVFLPSYSVGSDVYNQIPKVCGAYGKTAVVIGGKTAISKAKDALLAGVHNSNIEIIDFIWYGGDSTYANIKKLAQNPQFQKADMVFAVGGGRAIDTCKTLCDMENKPVFSFPTIASNCSPVTAVCVIYDDETHGFKELYFPQKKSPLHSFINTKIITEAPYEYIWAGIGDALSKQYETGFSSRNDEMSHTNALGVQISKNCSDTLLQYGLEALTSAKNHQVSEALEQVVLTIIVSTGLVSVLVINDYNSCLAHSIYYGCTMLPQGEKHLHGELVSYGVLVMLLLDKQQTEFEKVYAFNRQAKLPTCLKDIEISTKEELDIVLDKVMTTNDIVHVPYKITREMVYDAIMDLEIYHQEHLN